MHLTKNQIAIIFFGLIAVVGLVFVFKWLFAKKQGATPVAISIWGTDPASVMDSVDGLYTASRTNVTISYKQIPAAQYEGTLLNALAAGEGPDVYVIGSHAVPREKARIVAESTSTLVGAGLKGVFPDAVAQDFAADGKVWGLPLYLDTLALISNRDFLNQAAIVYPPATWADFEIDVNKLKIVNPDTNQVKRAGAAIGASQNSVWNAPDIVQALMLQNGAEMTDSSFTSAKFDERAGVDALNFYLQFGEISSPHYTWNEGQAPSRSAFAAGSAAMIADYQSAIPEIKSKNPFLNFQVSALPQVSTTTAVSFPNYEGLVVSKQSKNPAWGWDFITYVTMTPQVADSYSKASGRPPALLALINADLADPDLAVFARQALTARSWYEADDVKINELFNNAIVGVMQGQYDTEKALKIAADQTTVLMQK